MNQEALKLGNGSKSDFVASEDSPQHAVRDPHNPVLQSAGTPGDVGCWINCVTAGLRLKLVLT